MATDRQRGPVNAADQARDELRDAVAHLERATVPQAPLRRTVRDTRETIDSALDGSGVQTQYRVTERVAETLRGLDERPGTTPARVRTALSAVERALGHWEEHIDQPACPVCDYSKSDVADHIAREHEPAEVGLDGD